jgi:hypothetical protein
LTIRVPIGWGLLLLACIAGVVTCSVAWIVLLSTICSNPRAPDPLTQQVVPYNCHGMTVFMSPWDETKLHWLMPVMLGFLLLGMLSGARIAWSAVVVGATPFRVRIVAVPAGEAPEWVRQKWVGLELPLAQILPTARRGLGRGVLAGPLMLGRYRMRRGYRVNVLDANAVLERTSPDAARWWRTNTPHLMAPSRCFLFAEEACEVVSDRA